MAPGKDAARHFRTGSRQCLEMRSCADSNHTQPGRSLDAACGDSQTPSVKGRGIEAAKHVRAGIGAPQVAWVDMGDPHDALAS